MNSGVPGELIGTRETLCAPGESTCMWLLAGMGSNVPSLMFQAVKGLFANGTFVWPGEFRFWGRSRGRRGRCSSGCGPSEVGASGFMVLLREREQDKAEGQKTGRG